MDELKILKSKAYEKLIDDDVRKWSRAYCLVRRYDLMTTNIVDHSFFPPSLIGSSVRYRVENINRPVLQVNLQTHPVPVTLHNEKDLNTSKNSLMKNI